MKKVSVLLVGMMLLSTLMFGQRFHRDGGKTTARQAERMKRVLQLSDDQFGKVQGIHQRFAESRSKLRADTSVTVGHARMQARKLDESYRLELKSVLTAEQWEKWTAMKSRHEGHRRHHHRGDGRG